MTDAQPNVHRRRLGLALKALRKEAGLSLEQAAQLVGLSGQSALSKIENARQRVQPSMMAAFFEAYGCTDSRRKEEIKELATLAYKGKPSNLLNEFRGTIRDPFAEYLTLEQVATRSDTFASVIPGLLQTEAYATTVVERSRKWHHADQIKNFVKLRMARQAVLTRDEPLKLWCILDEAALYRQMGGKEVMRDQLQRLVDITTQHKHIAIQVLPFDYGAHAGLDGSFHLMRFAGGPPVVAIEPMTTAIYLEENSDTDRYETAFNHLRTEALDPEASRRHIQILIKERYS
ncbi:helix-turn-helix transcriptional regulator [Streptomyces sp. UNOC14_S4]|uniref:helix-turn-helix domain-containing protein n=1 Tax=Streptomyces sp. UNOC14_S4 TaxID=2872340 RepID=UPI001E53340E|nr:helix-turn-helix transcriptional regulator [Streptomyces sp. UNOC14_S4]MCC3766057.1 helix-turn-helix domain-containing protein [Streptomyces sp. UNOC14_S4]